MGTHLMHDVARENGGRAAFLFMGRAGNMMEWWSMSHSGEKGGNHGGYNI